MKDFKIETESPLSIAEQIEVLELAKGAMVSLSVSSVCIGICCAINCVIYEKYNHLVELARDGGIYNVIPLFTFDNAVLHGTVSNDASSDWFWWDREISKGGFTKRLAFLDWLIERLKEDERESTKRTTTE